MLSSLFEFILDILHTIFSHRYRRSLLGLSVVALVFIVISYFIYNL